MIIPKFGPISLKGLNIKPKATAQAFVKKINYMLQLKQIRILSRVLRFHHLFHNVLRDRTGKQNRPLQMHIRMMTA